MAVVAKAKKKGKLQIRSNKVLEVGIMAHFSWFGAPTCRI